MHQVVGDLHARQSDGERFEHQQAPRDAPHVPGDASGESLGPTGEAPDPTPLPYQPVEQPPADIAGRTGEQDDPWLGRSRRDGDLGCLLPSADGLCHRGTHAALDVCLASAASLRSRLIRRVATESLSASSQASTSSSPKYATSTVAGIVVASTSSTRGKSAIRRRAEGKSPFGERRGRGLW